MGSISCQLLITLGADTHTHTQTHTHTDVCGQSHSKKPGRHRPVAGTPGLKTL